jgi:flagellar biosynthesis protein FlhF
MAAVQNPQLYVKSYFASSVQDAIETARQEMGVDALLLKSRPAPAEARHLGEFEIVFGSYAQAQPAAPDPPPASRGVDDLRRQMDEIRNLLLRNAVAAGSIHDRQPLVEQLLLDAGIAGALAAEIQDGVQDRLNLRSVHELSRVRKPREWETDAVLQEMTAEIAGRFNVQPELSRITALVGPPGAGKTTTLVKLAVSQCMTAGRPVRLISTDTQRIGAAEQLRTFAAILGVPFQTAESTAALAQAIDNAPSNTSVLVDTPGLSPAMLGDLGNELAAFLASRQEIDTHLVLTATGRPKDLAGAANRFEVFRPSRLIFTRLDETDSLGPLFCEAARGGKPVSYLCWGQLIPEDIEPASKSRITESLVRQLPKALRAAA